MTQRRNSRWKIVLAALLCAIGLTVPAAHLLSHHVVGKEAERLAEIVAALQASDPAFQDLQVARTNHPRALIIGEVESRSLVDAVRARVAEAFGSERADAIVSLVTVRHRDAPVPDATGSPDRDQPDSRLPITP